MPAVSIIIPAFNSAATLPRALDSTLFQTLGDFEVLIADDGSEDATLEIAENYARRDRRIRILRLPHGVASAARNCALAEARGAYIAFLDSDDRLFTGSLATLYSMARQGISRGMVDISLGTFARVPLGMPPGRAEHVTAVVERISARHSALYFMEGFWAALYRRAFLAEHRLRFDESLISGGDTLFLAQAVTACGQLACCRAPVYCYIFRPGSLDAGAERLEQAKVDSYLRALSQAFASLQTAFPRHKAEDVGFALESMLHRLGNTVWLKASSPADRQRCRQRCQELCAALPGPLSMAVRSWNSQRIAQHQRAAPAASDMQP